MEESGVNPPKKLDCELLDNWRLDCLADHHIVHLKQHVVACMCTVSEYSAWSPA